MNTQNANWALFYRYEDGRPVEFRELRLWKSQLFIGSGSVCTFGERIDKGYEDPTSARQAFDAELSQQATAGFALVRTGVLDTATLDFQWLTEEIREGARKAFQDIRKSHAAKSMTGFALVSDSSGMTIVPAASFAGGSQSEATDDDCRWNTGEWPSSDGGEFLDIAYRLILTQHRDSPDTEIEFGDFINGFRESCVSALEALDREGLFGTGVAREDFVLLYQESDSEELDDAVRRLNPPKLYREYGAWLDSWN